MRDEKQVDRGVLARVSGLHAKIAADANLPNVVHCPECRREQAVDPARCLATGWPTCCGGTTMRLGPTPATPRP